MTFAQNLSKINKLVFVFGISPYLLNEKTNRFECSVRTLIYSFVYSLSISVTLQYMALSYYVATGEMFQSTFMILTLLQQATIMIIFYSTMLDLLLKREKHAKFLNNLVELNSNLTKFSTNHDGNNCDKELLSLHNYHILVIGFYASICTVSSIINRNVMQPFEHLWNALQFCQTMSLTMVGYYIRCFAIILHQSCSPIFKSLDSIGNDLRYTNNKNERITDLIECFEAFDEVMNLKKQLSSIFGIQLLLNSAFDFMILTISVYGLLYFNSKSIALLYYFIAYSLPHGIKCVLLVLALDTLANQVINNAKWHVQKLCFYFLCN